MAGDFPLEKLVSFLKHRKILDPVLTINSFYDKDNILQKKLRYYSESKIPVAIFVLHAVQPDV